MYVRGSTQLIQSGSEAPVRGNETSDWQRIAEYAYTDQTTPVTPYTPGDTQFRSFSAINGVISRTPEPVMALDTKEPPGDLISRHIREDLPFYEGNDPDTAVVTDFGAKPGDPLTPTSRISSDLLLERDDTAAIQAAIDHSPGGRVFLPKGEYFITRPLQLGPGTKLFGVAQGLTRITSHPVVWHGEYDRFMIETVDDPDADTYMGFLELGSAPRGEESVNKGYMHWRAGENSMTVAVKFAKGWKSHVTEKIRYLSEFSGNAGGRHYFISGHNYSVEASSNAATRMVYINGTSNLLKFYGLNVEGSKAGSFSKLFYSAEGVMDTNIEIVDSENIRIYNMKREGVSPSVVIRDSNNIGLFSMGRLNFTLHPQSDEGYVQIYGDCDNIVMSVLGADTFNGFRPAAALEEPVGDHPVLKEALNGKATTIVEWPDSISVYKRGELVNTPGSD